MSDDTTTKKYAMSFFLRCHDRDVQVGPIWCGVSLMLYQFAVGLTMRWFDGPAMRAYVGPLRVWATWLPGTANKERNSSGTAPGSSNSSSTNSLIKSKESHDHEHCPCNAHERPSARAFATASRYASSEQFIYAALPL